MKFKILLLAFVFIGQNLYPFEPLTPGKATKKASDEYEQVHGGVSFDGDYLTNYYGTNIPPSFACYDAKGKYKFKEFSLEDFICQSRTTAFRDNYFSDLYNLIVKENPKLKAKARERINKTQKECIIPDAKEYKKRYKDNFSISGAIHCTRSYYRSYTAKLALMLYKNDQKLFERIYDEDYEYFKEVFEDTLKYVPILHSEVGLSGIKKTDDKPYAEFLRKYDDYAADIYGDYHIHDLLYIVLVQYSLIDEKGHLVLPEDRKEEEE